ncbi:MAG: VTT domain-containing protein [Candidatus Shapirobacteria bacterium]|jgi:membrane protein DedA with SNARE-associated domain
MTQILNFILDLIKTNSLLAMFGGGFIEQIIVPIPSPIIGMAGGAFIIDRNIPFFTALVQIFQKVSLPYSIGATLGTSLVYLIAFYGGKPLIEKFGKYFGISWKLIEKIRTDFQKTIADELFILISCSIPMVPVSLITAFCGGFKVPAVKYYPMVFIALLIRSTILGFLGFQMGEAFLGLAHGLDKVESVLTVIGAGLILGFLFLKREKWLKKNE